MISVTTGVRPDQVLMQDQHVLFVEGQDQDAVDPKALDALFEQGLRIEPLGPSFSVRSVAEALHQHHPTYYFLIDRDHHDDAFVDRCWNRFPRPDTHNLLVWRRREIENYFLDPDYLEHSRYCLVDKTELARRILEFARGRIFLDTANRVVISIREELKRNWIEKFSDPLEFPTKAAALKKLKATRKFRERRAGVDFKLSPEEVERRFTELLKRMTGGKDPIEFDSGEWIQFIQGKKVLAQLVNSQCFQVKTTDGNTLSGREKLNEIVKDLLQNRDAQQPPDFVGLRDKINKRISQSN